MRPPSRDLPHRSTRPDASGIGHLPSHRGEARRTATSAPRRLAAAGGLAIAAVAAGALAATLSAPASAAAPTERPAITGSIDIGTETVPESSPTSTTIGTIDIGTETVPENPSTSTTIPEIDLPNEFVPDHPPTTSTTIPRIDLPDESGPFVPPTTEPPGEARPGGSVAPAPPAAPVEAPPRLAG